MTAANRFRPFPFFAILLLAMLAAAPPAQAQSTIADARDQGDGATVTVDGTVTRAYGDFVRLQDQSGPTGASALVIRQTEGDFYDDVQDGTIQPGTQLTVTGTLSTFNGLLQVNEGDLSDYSVDGQTDVPEPQTITLQQLQENGGDYASELVRVQELRFTNAGGSFAEDRSYDVTDDTTTLTFRVQGTDETAIIDEPVPGGAFTYTGVTGTFFPENFDAPTYQLIPVRPSDVEPTPSVSFGGRPYALAYEQDGEQNASVTVRAFALGEGQDVTVTVSAASAGTATAADVDGFDGTQELTFSAGGDQTQTLTFTAADDDETEGIERLELQLSSSDVLTGPRFTLWILDDPAAQTTLFADLQGQALRDQLRETFASDADGTPGPPTLGYDVARDTLYSVVWNDMGEVCGIYTDFCLELVPGQDPSTTLFQDGAGISAEHVYPRSKGAENEPAKSNMHNLVPARNAVNLARSNYPYAEIPDEDTDTWYFEDQSQSAIPSENIDAWSELNETGSDNQFEPRELVEGNLARKVFYFAMAYPSRADGSFLNEQKATLRQWNAQDPVDAAEQRRNVLVASYQGDALNPFQLDSSLVRRAFFAEGGGGDEVITIAAARDMLGGTTVTVEGVITRVSGNNVRIQDQSGPTGASGIVVRYGVLADSIESGSVSAGERIRVTGPLDAYNNLRQINNGSDAGSVSYEVIAEDAGLPDVQEVTVAELAGSGEDYESELVRVDGLSIDPDGGDDDSDPDGTFNAGGPEGNYTATGPDGDDITLRIPDGSFYGDEPIPDTDQTFEGVAGQFGTEAPANGYQLVAIDGGDLSGTGGGGGDMLTVDISRSFGDPDAPEGYRLVALPGAVDRPLAQTLDGTNGSTWQAYWDDGSESDYYIEWTGDSETFDFRPGRGFWLISEYAWTVQTSIPAVEPAEDGSYAIDLHEGWNIISNPLAEGVAWSGVEEANGGMLQPIWRFSGNYTQPETFASAQTNGEAFYFFNNSDLDELVIPPPSASNATVARASAESGSAEALTLTTSRAGRRTSTARLGTAAGAAEGLDAYDTFAPPGRFEAASLRLPLPGGGRPAGKRRQQLAGERRAPDRDGYAFDLVLRAAPLGGPVTLRAGGLGAFGDKALYLVEPATGAAHDLRTERRIEITPSQKETPLRLLVGSAAVAEGLTLPDEVTLRPGYPNPFSQDVTLKYDLPEEAKVRVAVFDLLGRRVRTLADGRREAGPHTIRWNGRAGGGTPLASGVYFVRLTAGDVVRSEKVVRVK